MSIAQLQYESDIRTIFGSVRIINKNDSTSLTTGSLIVEGGCSIQKNVSVGGTLDINGGLLVDGSFDVSGQLLINDTHDSTSFTSGAFICTGGVGIAKSVYIGQNLNVAGILTTQSIIYEESEVITSTTDSTSITSGASVVMGGAGVVKNVNIGGVTHIYDTTNSTDTRTGSMIINGGESIMKNLYVGGSIYGNLVGSFQTTTEDSTSTNSGALVVSGGVGIAKNIYVGGNITCPTEKITQNVLSTDYTTGSLIVTGGVGIGHNLNIYGDLSSLGTSSLYSAKINSGLETSTTSDGSFVVAGGVGIAKNMRVGGVIYGNVSGTVNGVSTTQAYFDDTTYIATDAFVKNAVMTQNIVKNSPNGFENQTDSTITYDPSTRIFTIAPTVTSYNIWISGVRITYTTQLQTLTHANTAGNYYFYFENGSGLLQSTSRPSYFTSATCAVVTYLGSGIGFANEERHLCIMDPATHQELHTNIGMYRVSGCTIGGTYQLSPTVPTDATNQFTLTSGVVSDETLLTTISALSAGAYNVTQLSGVSVAWTYSVLTVPLYYVTTGFIQYNQYTGGAWQMTPLANDRYVNYYVIAVPSFGSTTQIFIKSGQTVYNSLTSAQAETYSSLVNSGYAPIEFVPLYQITYHTGNYTGALGKCRIESVQQIVGSKATIAITAQINNHDSLLGLNLASTGITWGHVNDQPQTIYGVKTFSDTTQATSATNGGLVVSGGLGVAKNLYVGGISSIISTTANQLTLGYDATNKILFNVTSGGDLAIDASGNDINFNNTDTINILSVTGLTSLTTGALIVAGGASFGKSIYSGNNIMSTTSTVRNSTICSTISELSTGDMSISSYNAPTNSVFVAKLENSGVACLVPSATAYNNPTIAGTVTFSGGKCNMLSGAGSLTYNLGATNWQATTGSIRFKYTPNYNCSDVGTNINMFYLSNDATGYGCMKYIFIYGTRKHFVTFYTSTGGTLDNTPPFVNYLQGVEYEIEIGWNFTTTTCYVFVDGVLIQQYSMGATVTNNNPSTILLGGTIPNASFSDVMIFSTIQHTATYTLPSDILSGYINMGTKCGIKTDNVTIRSTTGSTSTTTGALVIAGGVGIGGDFYCNNIFTGYSTSILVDTSGPSVKTGLTLYITKVCHMVSIYLPYFSDISTYSDTGSLSVPIPTGYRPGSECDALCLTASGGSYNQGMVLIGTNGIVRVLYTPSVNNFPASSTWGFSLNVTYYV